MNEKKLFMYVIEQLAEARAKYDELGKDIEMGPYYQGKIEVLEDIGVRLQTDNWDAPEPHTNNESPPCSCGEPTCMGTCYRDSD